MDEDDEDFDDMDEEDDEEAFEEEVCIALYVLNNCWLIRATGLGLRCRPPSTAPCPTQAPPSRSIYRIRQPRRVQTTVI